MARQRPPRKPANKAIPAKERTRLLALLRLTASNRDGEALAALRRAAALMERVELDWEALVAEDPRPVARHDAEVLEALSAAREAGRRQGRAEAACAHAQVIERAREEGFDEGFGRGLVLGRALGRAGVDASDVPGPVGEASSGILDLDRHRGRRDPTRAWIAAVLDNPAAPPRTLAFVADLGRWLDTRGALTPAQREALEATHRRWGRGAA